MTINDTVKVMNEDDFKDKFSELNDSDYCEIEEIQGRIHLRNAIKFYKELDNFIKDNTLEDKQFIVSRESNPSESITTEGWWSLRIDVEDPVTGSEVISDGLYYDLLDIANTFNNYYFEARINEKYEDKVFRFLGCEIEKVYDFLLPDRTLSEFRASLLEQSLPESGSKNQKRMKM